jgi:hypothetical protein
VNPNAPVTAALVAIPLLDSVKCATAS